MELAMDYLNDEEVFKPEIDIYKKQRLDEEAKRTKSSTIQEPVQKVTPRQNKLIYDEREDTEEDSAEDLGDGLDWEEDTGEDEDNEIDSEETNEILDSSSTDEGSDNEDESLDGLEFEEPDDEDLEGYEDEPEPVKQAPTKSQAEIELERKLAEAERRLAEQEIIRQRQKQEEAERARRAKEAEAARAAKEAEASKPIKTAREIELEQKLAEMQRKLAGSAGADVPKVKKQEQHPVQKQVKQTAKVTTKTVASRQVDTEHREAVKTQRKPQATAFKAEDKSKYNTLDINALYTEVKNYMLSRGIEARTIKRVELESIFGTENIKRLTVKSYLITLRNNEVTMGR